MSVSPASIVGQSGGQGTVTLTAAAPSGGAVVVLESSNREIARVPASATVSSGSTTASFTVDTSTVTVATASTITATYAGVARTTTVTVTTPTPRAVFTVTSPSRGANACVLVEAGNDFDCRLDGSASEGALTTWTWALVTSNNRHTEIRGDGVWVPDISNGCTFLDGASSSIDSSGNRFITLTVTLQVKDRSGRDSSVTSRDVRLYPDRKCGRDF